MCGIEQVEICILPEKQADRCRRRGVGGSQEEVRGATFLSSTRITRLRALHGILAIDRHASVTSVAMWACSCLVVQRTIRAHL